MIVEISLAGNEYPVDAFGSRVRTRTPFLTIKTVDKKCIYVGMFLMDLMQICTVMSDKIASTHWISSFSYAIFPITGCIVLTDFDWKRYEIVLMTGKTDAYKNPLHRMRKWRCNCWIRSLSPATERKQQYKYDEISLVKYYLFSVPLFTLLSMGLWHAWVCYICFIPFPHKSRNQRKSSHIQARAETCISRRSYLLRHHFVFSL